MGQVIDADGNIITLRNALGKGGGGSAYSALDESGNTVVVKLMNSEGEAFGSSGLTTAQLAKAEFETLVARSNASDVYAQPYSLIHDGNGDLIGYSLEKITGINPTDYKMLSTERIDRIFMGTPVPDEVSNRFITEIGTMTLPHGDLLDPYTAEVIGRNIIFEKKGGIPFLRDNPIIASMHPKIGGEVTNIRLIDPFLDDRIHTISSIIEDTTSLEDILRIENNSLTKWFNTNVQNKPVTQAITLTFQDSITQWKANKLARAFDQNPFQYLPTTIIEELQSPPPDKILPIIKELIEDPF